MEFNELNEQEIIRRESLTAMRELGIEPYPAEAYPVDITTREIKDRYNPENPNLNNITIAGRIMTRRVMGAASFIELQDETGRIQVYIKRDDICPDEDKTMYNTIFKKLLDIGDIIGVKGYAFVTNAGELSVHAQEIKSSVNHFGYFLLLKRKRVRNMTPLPIPNKGTE